MFKMAEDSLFLETLSLTSVDERCIATIATAQRTKKRTNSVEFL